MQPRLNPHVVDHYPGNLDSDIALNTVIRVKFSKNLNDESINQNTFMVVQQGTGYINGELEYERSTKTIVFKPDELKSGLKYQVIIVGDLDSNDPEKTILDALDKPLETNYTFSFTTTNIPIVKTPEIISPDHQTIVSSLNFSWSKVENANTYKVLISKDKLFDKSNYEETVSETKISINNLDLNNEYFIKVKAVVGDEESEWSKVHSFYYEKLLDEQSSNQSGSISLSENQVSLLNPKGRIEVSPDLNEIIIEIDEMVELDEIDVYLVGKAINNIPYIESDGEKSGSLEIIEQKEGYTKIRYVI